MWVLQTHRGPPLFQVLIRITCTTPCASWLKTSFQSNSSIISLFHVVQARREFYIKNNVHPFKSYIAILSSAPIWITVSLPLRTMSGQFSEPPFSGFSSEGGVWFTNLCMSDPTYTLPVLLGELVPCLDIAKCKFHYKIWTMFMTQFAGIVFGSGNVILTSSPHYFWETGVLKWLRFSSWEFLSTS